MLSMKLAVQALLMPKGLCYSSADKLIKRGRGLTSAKHLMTNK